MSTRNTRAAEPPNRQFPIYPDQTALNEALKHQMACATRASAILFHGSEMIRQVQQQTAHDASAQHEMVANHLSQDCTPSQVSALQSQLINFDIQSAANYWQAISSALMKTQAELMACVSQTMGAHSHESANPTLEAWTNAMKNFVEGSGSTAATH